MSGVPTERLAADIDRPGALWVVTDGAGKNAGLVQCAAPGKYGAWRNEHFLGSFESISDAGEAVLQVREWEGGR
jgi:hypothetical protein